MCSNYIMCYDLYKNDYIPCSFCRKLVSLYNAKAHLTGKKCLQIQLLMDPEEHKNIYRDYCSLIYKMKSDIRMGIDDEMD